MDYNSLIIKIIIEINVIHRKPSKLYYNIKNQIFKSYKCDQLCQKGSYTQSFKTHFSSPSVTYINALTAYVFTTAES